MTAADSDRAAARPTARPAARRRPALVGAGAVAVLAVVAVVVAVLVSHHRGGSTGGRPPAFVPAPGTVRVTAQHGTGNPPPQVVTVGTIRLSVAFGVAGDHDGRPTAGLSLVALSEPGRPSKPYAVYSVGDGVTLGTVHITVLAIYAESDPAADAVDLEVTRS